MIEATHFLRRELRRPRADGAARRVSGPLAVLVAVLLGATSPAVADDFDDFEAARRAYQAQRYDDSRARFESLVGGQVPRLSSRPLILESRKYLGASYLFLGREKDAEAQFDQLIRMDNAYEIDPLAFPGEVIAVFERVRERTNRILEEAARQRRDQEEQARSDEARDIVEKQSRMLRIRELATSETVETQNSRVVAMIPFGVGQFQNRHDSLGTGLVISEGLLAVTSIVSFFLHESLRNEAPTEADRGDAEALRDGFKLTNWISTGALAVLAVVGIVDAQLRFEPDFKEVRERTLPDELKREFELSGAETPRPRAF